MKRIAAIGFIALAVAIAPVARAQFTNNFQTNTISGVTSNWTGIYIVGSNTFADVLAIQSSGVLSNGVSYVGYEVSSSNNLVLVSDSGSVWSNTGTFTLGFNGFGNRLVVSNGAKAFGATGFGSDYVGYNASSSNNNILVAGTGSVRSSKFSLYLGNNGRGNSLTVTNGGLSVNAECYVGYATTSTSNRMLVTGSGSVWSNTSFYYLGYGGSSNSVTVTEGATVYAGFYTRLGELSSSSNNTVVITGTNSQWVFNGDIYLGKDGSGNSMTISNGGALVSYGFNGYSAWLGYGTGANSNKMLVTGTSSVWTNLRGVVVGFLGGGNSLTITNGGAVLNRDNATVGNNGSGNTAFVAGNSVWSNGLYLAVGTFGAANTLTITSGGKVISNGGSVGDSTGGSNNLVVIAGSGSVWSNLSNLTVGNSGATNRMVISGGGQMVNAAGIVGASTRNSVLVTDSNSVWNNSGTVSVGKSGGGNSLVISNGGQVVASLQGTVGETGGSSNNSVLVTGAGSVWSNGDWFVVGGSGASNTMTIANGGQVISTSGIIGSSSRSNSVLVTGTGSLWRNSGTVAVGASTSGNSLVISNGGKVVCAFNFSGCGTSGGSSNTARVVDGGIWDSGRTLFIGSKFQTTSFSNSLTIAGGTVLVSNLFVACNNLIQLDSGSIFVTNSSGTALFEINGKFVMNGGTLRVDNILMTNSCAQFVRTGSTLIYGSAVLATNLDADGDGMANGWEQAYGLDPLNAADASADNDGDGFTNLQEYQAGTDPANSASAFRILSVVPTNDDVLISWTAGGGRTNVVQSVTNLTGSYSTISPNIILPGTGDVTTNYLDAGAATNGAGRFYKIRLVP